LGLGDLPPELETNANISPGQMVPVVTDPVTKNIELYKWGLIPGWAKDPKIGYKMFNARSETLTEKPSFRVSFARRRCLIPADGFYEWRMDGNQKYPYLFTLKDHRPFTFAGLWDVWKDPEGKETRSCTIITTEPNKLLAEYHNRMPVILTESNRWQWLEQTPPEILLKMLAPINEQLMSSPQKIEKL
jgi:putative SOS response-associated peptidase YedK